MFSFASYQDPSLPSTAGDVNSIQIGSNSNIQDGVTVHVARHNPQGNVVPTIIGNNVTIGKPLPTCSTQLSTATCQADLSPAHCPYNQSSTFEPMSRRLSAAHCVAAAHAAARGDVC